MSDTFIAAADEAFAMAMEMEQVGEQFYAALAQVSDDPQVRHFCHQLAVEEAAHLERFRLLRQQSTRPAEPPRLPPEQLESLRRLVRQQVVPDPQKVHQVALSGGRKDALAMAMQMERDAIRYYQGLAEHLPDLAETFEQIVSQEKAHLHRLSYMVA